MGITEKIDYLMAENRIKNKHQLAIMSGVAYTTLDSLYKKGADNVRRTTLNKLAKFFSCSLDYLANDDVTDINYGKSEGFSVDFDEMQHIQKYRTLDNHGKELVDTILGKEYGRIQTTPLQVKEQTIDIYRAARLNKELPADEYTPIAAHQDDGEDIEVQRKAMGEIKEEFEEK
jgi:DNA-binding Xre family transcriptional regulator